ncbi:S-layer homology domain-containing protein [Paenibacillus piri]|uniref:S-layer homology domain-containing protein n=1 Tax=Paenibacillus piri TaxID=2547395 RepID=A0A4R5KAS9_9BACL|nr:S-layer homology domain-containing protein [Paenibacillus piri]TDF92333.1 S-layer homology domain-containing protein [Paenibacillus piri]
MKKSLSMILSLAMAFSMFSSAAFGAAAAGKSSHDFSDLNDLDAATKEKFDAMISGGIFNGIADGTFGINDKMNRAQFAKVAALIFGLKINDTKTSSFADVKADDPANGYALPYIEAIVRAGITDGVAPGEFNPAGEVTMEQLAAFLIRGLGMDAQAKAMDGDDESVSSWAQGYVALALEKKLMTNGPDGLFGGTMPATREALVTSSYAAKQQFIKVPFNGSYAIESFQATDYNEFTLRLNAPLNDSDADAIKVNLDLNGSPFTSGYTTTWSEDKTSAVIKLDAKLGEAKWGVTLSGLNNLDEAHHTAQTETSPEKLEKIEVLAAGDSLPNNPGQKIRIDFYATNQYGARYSTSASDFDIHASQGTVTPIGGEQAFYLTLPDGTERNEQISLSVLHQNSNMQVNKLFTLGDKSVVTKIVAGDLLDSSGKKIEAINAHSYAYLDVKAYDQYGLRIEDKNALNKGIGLSISDNDLEKGNEGDVNGFVDDAIGDKAADLKLRYTSDMQKEIKVTLFPTGSNESVTKTIQTAAYKMPAKVEFGAYDYNLAKGDSITGDESTDHKMFMPIIVKDAQGNTLTPQEIYDNRNKLTVYAGGAVTLAQEPISNSGSHKGMIAIDRVDKNGEAAITVQLKDNAEVRVQKTLNVNDERKADTLKFSETPAKYMTAGADNELKVKLYDQYGGELKYDANDQYIVRYSLTANSGDEASLSATSLASVQKEDAANRDSARKYVLSPEEAGTTAVHDFKLAHDASDGKVDSMFDKAFKFYAGTDAKAAAYGFKATLYKQDNQGTVDIDGKKYVEVNTLTTTMEVLDPANSSNKLTYEAYLDKSNNTVLAADDYMDAGTGAAGAANVYENNKGFAKEVKIRAKKDGGEEVKVPTRIASISSSDSQVVNAAAKTNWVAGGKAGQAKLTVLYFDGKKDIANSSIDVTSKNEGPVVSEIALKKTGKTVKQADLQSGLYLWDAKLAEKLTVRDQYAGEFVAEHAPGSLNEEAAYNDNMIVKANGAGYNSNEVLKVSFYVSDIVGANPQAVTIDPATGLIKYNGKEGDVKSFKVNALAPSGVKASFDINVQ